MVMQYEIIYDKKFDKDIHLIELRSNSNYYKKLKNKIIAEVENLKCMPRAYKSLICQRDLKGEYRRIVLDKYILIYKIINNQIIILRIFSQKQNYLNSKNFILREKSNVYKIMK